jgi:Ca2+-binding RTX toxin-like protein
LTIITTYEFVSDIPEFIANGFQDADQFGATVTALAGGGFAVAYGNDFGSFLTPHVSFFDAGGTAVSGPLGSFFLPYTGTAAGVQMIGAPDILQLMNGNVLVTWNAVGSISDTELMSAVLNPLTGEVVTPEFLVQNVNLTTDFDTTQLTGGNRIYVLDGQFGTDVIVRSSAGSHIASYLFGDVFETYSTISVAALSSGQFAVCSLLDGAPALVYEIRNSNGVRAEATVRIDLPGSTDIGAPAIAALPQGGFAVAFANTLGGSAGLSLLIVTNSAINPTPIGPIRIDTDLSAAESEPSVTILVDGFILVSWTQSVGVDDTDIMGRIFDVNGVPLIVDGTDAPFVIAAGSSSASDSALADWGQGRFITTWTDSASDADGSSIRTEVQSLVRQTVGDSSANLMTGDGLSDRMIADNGNDTLNGLGGEDILNGGLGDDLLYGGTGNDLVSGGEGTDRLWGGLGADSHVGGDDAGLDYAHYDDADYGNLVIRLDNPGLNTGAAAGDTYSGIEGIVGGVGNDTIVGNASGNRLHGSDGTDLIYGGLGIDHVVGDAGGDHLWGGADADAHYGGDGPDYARYDDANHGNLTIRLDAPSLNTGAAAGDTYNNIEGLVGGTGNDTVGGDGQNNYLFGGANDDMVFGGAGNDFLSGDAGGDNLWGGAGADAHYGGNDAGIDYARYDDADRGNLTLRLDNAALNAGTGAVGDTYAGIEGLVGGAGADVIIGNASVNYLFGQGGADYIDGLGGSDYLNGGAGADRFRFSTALSGSNVDQIADFQHLVDDILLLQSVFAGIGPTLTADEFRIGMAQDANDRILYNNGTGQLYCDSNANVAGGMMLFATVTAGTVLTFDDFIMV